MSTEKNIIKNQLINLGICEDTSIEPYYPQVRDRNDVSVLKCKKSGVIFLSSSEHMNMTHYEEKERRDRKHAVNIGHEDRLRRKELIQNIVINRKWLDIGTGSGGILDELSPLVSKASAVEPHKVARDSLIQLGYDVYPNIESVTENDFDIITLFHVFEHFTNPIEDLKKIFKKLNNQGRVIIEVPQANDFLLSFFDHDSFKKFTFWSEHLILHTRDSLKRFLEEAGFEEIIINGCQRYPLANHLHWLSPGQPGGHEKWSFLRTKELDSAYAQMLAKMDKTDTLIAIATKPHKQ
jgi:SAM-dependent methyltransferase